MSTAVLEAAPAETIEWCACNCKVEDGKFNINRVPLGCDATWKLIASGHTVGVFQLEKRLGQEWARKVRPENINELADLLSLLRPGCLESGMTADYAAVKFGKKAASYPHPTLKPLLERTYGCLVYQEQAIRIAVEIAGFSLAQADNLRKGIGKKLPEVIAKLKKEFVDGAAKKGIVSRPVAEEIFGWIEAFQRYGFNKCVSGDTRIRRAGHNPCMPQGGYTIREMYRIRHDREFAQANGHEQLRRKWRRQGHYGYGLSLCEDGRIRQNIIRDISPAGTRPVVKIVVAGGGTICVTGNHKFPTPGGDVLACDLELGQQLFVCDRYEPSDFNAIGRFGDIPQQRTGKSYFNHKGSGFPVGAANPGYTNGAYSEFAANVAVLPMECDECSTTDHRLEVHHVDRDRSHNEMSNLRRLCASCHKKEEYGLGRTRRGEKGYPHKLVEIVGLFEAGEVDTWDVTMDGPDHNFVTGDGIVTCNSHAVSYAMVSYQTAYLKCHFPAEFYTSYLTYSGYKSDQMEEVYRLVQDARLFGIDVLPPDVRKGNPHFLMTDLGIVFGLSHIRGVGESALAKILEMQQPTGPTSVMEVVNPPLADVLQCADEGNNHVVGPTGKSLHTWSDFLAAVPELHRNVGEALIRSGACDCYGLSRPQMLAELQAILGTSTRDEKGDKAEIRGLTERERDWFFMHLATSGNVIASLQAMLADTAEDARPISKLSKSEIIAAILELSSQADAEALPKTSRKALETMLRGDLGYKPRRPAINGGSRRAAIEKKVEQLQVEREDTARIRAEAEKHYLGIALSCSPADDAETDHATATCLDVAKAPNGTKLTVLGIIDIVKHTKTKRGKAPGSPMCFLTISDSTYSLDHAVVFPGAYEELKTVCKEDLIVLATGQKRDGSFIIEDIRVLI